MKLSAYNVIVPQNENKGFLVFNTLTGSVISANDRVASCIDRNDVDALNYEDVDFLKNYGIVIDDSYDECSVYAYWMNKTKFSTKVVSATVLLTHRCNFRCTYCYEGAGEILSDTMTKETALKIATLLKSVSTDCGSEFVSVILFGGEPLMNIDVGFTLLDELAAYCKENKKTLITGIITNGSLLNEEIIKRLQGYNCKYIQITLDGPPEIHDKRRVAKNGSGTFDKVLNSIKLVDDNYHGTQVVRINVDRENLTDVNPVLNILKQAGLKKVSIDYGIVRSSTDACSSYSNNCLNDDELGDVLDGLWKLTEQHGFVQNKRPSRKWLYCGLYNDYSHTFAPDGDMYKCWEMVGKEEHIMGKFDSNGNLLYTNAYWDWMSHNPLDIPECVKCKYLPACGGGCGAGSFKDSGTYHAQACFKTKGVIEKQILRMYENAESATPLA